MSSSRKKQQQKKCRTVNKSSIYLCDACMFIVHLLASSSRSATPENRFISFHVELWFRSQHASSVSFWERNRPEGISLYVRDYLLLPFILFMCAVFGFSSTQKQQKRWRQKMRKQKQWCFTTFFTFYVGIRFSSTYNVCNNRKKGEKNAPCRELHRSENKVTNTTNEMNQIVRVENWRSASVCARCTDVVAGKESFFATATALDRRAIELIFALNLPSTILSLSLLPSPSLSFAVSIALSLFPDWIKYICFSNLPPNIWHNSKGT